MKRIEIDESEVEITTLELKNNDVFIEFDSTGLSYAYILHILDSESEPLMFRNKRYRVDDFECNLETHYDGIGIRKRGIKHRGIRLHLMLTKSQKRQDRQDKIDELLK